MSTGKPTTPWQASSATRVSFSGFENDIEAARSLRSKEDPAAHQVENPNAWSILSKSLRDFDEQKIGSYKEDIDTLLVFAGLFSAVLATLSIESYKLLQPDSNQLTVQLLSQISQQLNSFAVNASSINSSFQALPVLSSDFKPSTQVVVINLFWFLGLILALITASLGMLVKQWLREYLSNDSTSPQARARIRYTRHDSLERWYVFVIAGALPSLLQGSLAFSLVALCLFIRQFHQTLFYFLMSVSLLWFLFYGFVLVAPIFSSHCPYKSPSLRSTTRSLRHSVHHLLRTFFHLPQPYFSFLDPGSLVEEADIRISSEHDEYIWTQADALFFDDRLVKETVHMCLADVDGPAVVRCVQSIASRREPKVEPSNLIEHGQDSVSLALLNALVREVHTQIHGKETFEWKSWMREAYSLLLENWEYCSDDVGKHHLADFLLAVIKQDWAISEHILRWRPDLSLPVLYFALKEGKVVHQNDSDSRKLFIIHQTVRSVRALLTLGPLSLQLPAGIASSAPHSGVINVITVCKVLLQSISSAPLLDMNIGAGLRRALEFTAEISVLIDKVIHDVRRDLEQGDCPAWASMDQNETWESVRQMLKTIATTMDHNSIKGHTKKEWLTEFRDLHEITEQKRSQLFLLVP